jgi:polysaccharide pyruvyl transferase WcaK-like protein
VIPRSHGGAPRNVALFGLFGIGNFGNEASLAAALEATKRVVPLSRVTAICGDPARVEREHGVPGRWINPSGRWGRFAAGRPLRRLAVWPIKEVARWRYAVRTLRGVDLMVIPGTGILDDFGQGPTQMPLALARWSVAARVTRARLVFLGIGAGPISHPVSRSLMRFALAQADFCSYRDDGSRRFMASIGRRTVDDEVWPDLVFGLEREPIRPRPEGGPFTVALGVMDYRGWRGGAGHDSDRIHDRYVERMVALASRLRACGYELRLVLGDDSDLDTAQIVAGRLRDPSVAIVSSGDFDDVCASLKDAHVLVSSRYHNLVAALMTGVPAISLSYADKNDQLLGAFGLGEYCQHIETFDVDVVLAHVEAVRADHAALAAEVTRRAVATGSEVRRLLDSQLQSHRPLVDPGPRTTTRHERPTSVRPPVVSDARRHTADVAGPPQESQGLDGLLPSASFVGEADTRTPRGTTMGIERSESQ